MSYIVKRKFQGALGDNVDNAQMSSLLQHIQTSTGGIVGTYDELIVNHLVVKKTLKIPFGVDKYR